MIMQVPTTFVNDTREFESGGPVRVSVTYDRAYMNQSAAIEAAISALKTEYAILRKMRR